MAALQSRQTLLRAKQPHNDNIVSFQKFASLIFASVALEIVRDLEQKTIISVLVTLRDCCAMGRRSLLTRRGVKGLQVQGRHLRQARESADVAPGVELEGPPPKLRRKATSDYREDAGLARYYIDDPATTSAIDDNKNIVVNVKALQAIVDFVGTHAKECCTPQLLESS